MEVEVNDLKKKIEMMEQLSKSAAMVLQRGAEFDDLEGVNSGQDMGELKDFEDMDNAGGGGEYAEGNYDPIDGSNNNSRKHSMRDNRRATFMVDLN